MLLRRVAFPDFCEPCLPSPADKPPAGAGWLHEIKHDGFRMLVRRDAAGVRLFTRNGHDWTGRFSLIARAALSLKTASCLIDGEAVACDEDGLPVFDRLRYRRDDRRVFLYAFDLIELDDDDFRAFRMRWVATVNSDRSTTAFHRIPPGANAAHSLVIAVDHLQRCAVRLRSWHRRVWRRIWRRWSFTQRFEQPLYVSAWRIACCQTIARLTP
jgi:hypothetical protein